MKYFARIDKKQVGPLSLDELVKAGVRPSTWVWAKGMPDWQRAEDVPEICRGVRRMLAGFDPETGELIDRDTKADDGEIKNRPEASDSNSTRIFLHAIPESPDTTDYSVPPRNVSIVLAVVLTVMCFPITGIVAIWFAMKTKSDWKISQQNGLPQKVADSWKRKAHDDARIYRMMLGITFFVGIMALGFTLMRHLG